MGVKLIQETTLTNIANAIRGVDNTTDLIDPSDFAARISAFSVGTANPKAIIKVISAPVDCVVSATDGVNTVTGTVTDSTGYLFLMLPNSGTWTVNFIMNGNITSTSVALTEYDYQLVKYIEYIIPGEYTELINTAISDGSLNSLSWTDIETLADGLATGALAASDASGLLGLSKSFKYNGSTTCYAFILGIMQDYLDTTPRGLTFWCVGCNNPFEAYSNLAVDNVTELSPVTYQSDGKYGWGGDNFVKNIRSPLQVDGDIYNKMPSDIKSVMKTKTTYYGNKSVSADILTTTDNMFVPSVKELYGLDDYSFEFSISTSDTTFWQHEGTGASHNEQYQLFATQGITYENYNALNSSHKKALRTLSIVSEYEQTMAVNYDGSLDNSWSYPGWYDITPCFCV